MTAHTLPKCPECYGDGFDMGVEGPYICTVCKGQGRRKVAALALLVNDKGEVLAVSRKTDHNDLGFPGGKVEPDEDVEHALVRELEEETGCKAERFSRVFAMEDAGGYWAVTFRVSAWSGTPVAREASSVLWVPPSRMLEASCSWVEYNRALFYAARQYLSGSF